jgi:hypothetical protein
MGLIETTEEAVKIAARDRLSGHDQGLGRRRRQGHPRRPLDDDDMAEGFAAVKAEA